MLCSSRVRAISIHSTKTPRLCAQAMLICVRVSTDCGLIGAGALRCGVEYGGQVPAHYFRGRALDQYSVNAALSVLRNHSATSFAWKGRSSRSSSQLSKSVISSAVLGFLILFSARKMCSLRRRVEFGIFFIAGSSVPKN